MASNDITPTPAQPRRPKSRPKTAFVPPNDRYAAATPWPADLATLQGVHDMQGHRFISVRLNPLAYVGATRTLFLREKITVTVRYDLAPARPHPLAEAACPLGGGQPVGRTGQGDRTAHAGDRMTTDHGIADSPDTVEVGAAVLVDHDESSGGIDVDRLTEQRSDTAGARTRPHRRSPEGDQAG